MKVWSRWIERFWDYSWHNTTNAILDDI